MKPANVWHLYRVRMRARRLQEIFAAVGIAAGVALLFSSQVAGSSLLSSAAQLSRGIVGRASLQLIARDPHGFPEAMLAQVRHIAGVNDAAPLLEASANAIGPSGSESVELVGVDASLARLGGALARHSAVAPFHGIGAVVLPSSVASVVGVRKFGQELTLQAAGRSVSAPLYADLGEKQLGPLAASPIAVTSLEFAQETTGLRGRVSRILVLVSRGLETQVKAALTVLAAGRLNVETTSYDEKLFAKAAAVSNQSTALFAVISSLVGFLFAFNAMLLTAPQRRRLIADLRRDGYAPRTVLAVLLFDGLLLGVGACALGLLLGNEVSIHLLHAVPGYLSSAFAVGSRRVVGLTSVAIAVGGGMLAAVAGVLSPLRDILSRDPLAAVSEKGSAGNDGHPLAAAVGALACLAAATTVLLAAPQAAIAGMVLLVGSLLLALPLALRATLAAVGLLARALTSAVPHVAAMELRAARTRAVGIAATAAVAVFGSVAIEGAHGDLLRGLENAAHDMNAFTDVWVAPSGSYNLLRTTPFQPRQASGLARLPGVRAVQIYRGGLLDIGPRRVWVIAPPSQASSLLPPSQILDGRLAQASDRVRRGGWMVVSQALAGEHHLHIGQSFLLPSPRPTSFRVAALSTNIGWAPGAIIMNASDYSRAWATSDASAYDLLLAPGARAAAVSREARGVLGAASGLVVQSAGEHADLQRALSRQGLVRLLRIATLIMLGAVLAIAAAMGTMVWQRRPRLAKLKLEGFRRSELWRTVLLESVLLLGVGCTTGALFGLYGQQLLDRALASVINFPVVYSVAAGSAASSLVLVLAAGVAALAVPGYLATRVSPAVALED